LSSFEGLGWRWKRCFEGGMVSNMNWSIFKKKFMLKKLTIMIADLSAVTEWYKILQLLDYITMVYGYQTSLLAEAIKVSNQGNRS
jgi:hypothetical protein